MKRSANHLSQLSRPVACALVALLMACSSPYEQVDPETGIPILPVPAADGLGQVSQALSAELQPVSGCDELVQQLKARAIQEMAAALQQSFAYDWKQDNCSQVYGWSDGGMWAADSGAVAVPQEPSGSETPEHSATNNQVQGVDEADMVKTDGNYVYVVRDHALQIIRSWPAAETQQVGQLALEGRGLKLFLRGDRVLVYSALGSATSWGGSGSCTYGYGCVPHGDGSGTKLTVVDVSDHSRPRVVREVRSSASLLAARRISAAVHTVLVSPVAGFGGLRTWVEMDTCASTPVQIYKAYKKLMQANVQAILATTVSQLLPTVSDTVHGAAGSQQNPDPMTQCQGFLRSAIPNGDQLTSLLTLSMDSAQPVRAVGIASRAGVVYANQDALYLAVPRQRDSWGWFGGWSQSSSATAVHKFQLDPSGASYQASGLVKGWVLNQFALDEYQGYLRVATTTRDNGLENALTVLRPQGAALEQVGQLSHLAPTEDIRAVRFDGERGYVVTFKKTDPLFVLDLARPEQPRVLGELKIPGFSTYMHRMDDGHLLTIGYDADDQGSFAWFSSVMLQIFDVSDPTHPQLKFKHVIGTRGSSSEAATNHLAFTYYKPKDLLALPMTVCEESSGGGDYGDQLTFSGLLVFDVTAADGFSLKGKVPHPMESNIGCTNWWTDSRSVVRRSLIIGDYVYSLSDSRLKVNALADLSTDLAEVPLQ